MIINGLSIANSIKEKVKKKLSSIIVKPALHVILVGNNPASALYVSKKKEACEFVGLNSVIHHHKESITTDELCNIIKSLNGDMQVSTILVQLPLPDHINQHQVLEAICPYKDVDGLTSKNLGLLMQNKPGITPCTPQGCLQLIQHVEKNIEGKKAVVIGRSTLVGKPMALLLTNQNATVSLCHSKTNDLKKITQQADIIISAIGKPYFIDESFIGHNKPIIIDVGISRGNDEKTYGDVCFETIFPLVRAITPVPGGVGPMTVANLLLNTLKCANISYDDIE